MWSDNIAERDYLGFDVHANLIKGLIDEPVNRSNCRMLAAWLRSR